jgi:hypothetical protein
MEGAGARWFPFRTLSAAMSVSGGRYRWTHPVIPEAAVPVRDETAAGYVERVQACKPQPR